MSDIARLLLRIIVAKLIELAAVWATDKLAEMGSR